MTRACGECRACCSGPEIAELGKARFVACSHLAPSGCGIYGRHPESCRRYECAWIALPELLREDERPDRLGVVVTLNPSKFEYTGEVTTTTLDVWESETGTLDSEPAQEVLARLLEHASRSGGRIEGMELVRFGDPVFYWLAYESGTSLDARRRDLAGEDVEPFDRRPRRRRLPTWP